MSEFDKLIETLTDERASSFAKRNAIEALGALGDDRIVPHLVLALKDNDRYIRREAVRALGQVGSSQAVEPLLSVLEEEDDEYVLREAIVALGNIGDERAVEALTKILDSQWFLNRRAAQEALEQIEARQRDAQQEVETSSSLLEGETPKSPQTPVELEADEAEPISEEESPSVPEAPAETLEKKASVHEITRSEGFACTSRRQEQEQSIRAPEPTSQTPRGIIPQQPSEPRDQRGVSGKAIATFLCGMLCLLFRQPLFFIVGIVAILVGVAEIRAIRQQQTEQTGNTTSILRNAVVILGILFAGIGIFITLMSPMLSHRQRITYRQPTPISHMSLEQLQSEVKRNPQNVDAYKRMAEIYRQWGEEIKAIEVYEKASVLAPKDSNVHANLASLYQNQQLYDKAIVAYQKAIALSPQQSAWKENLAQCYEQVGKGEEEKMSAKPSSFAKLREEIQPPNEVSRVFVPNTRPPVRIGEAPDFSLQALDGKMISLSDFKGKVVILNFWATWAPSCIREMAALEELYKAHKDDLMVIGMSVDTDGEDAGKDIGKALMSCKAYIEKRKITYPVLIATEEMLVEYEFAIMEPIETIPTTIIVDKSGYIRSKHASAQRKDALERAYKSATLPSR